MKPDPAKRRRKKDPSTKREKEIKDKLRKLNPSLYNRTTGGKLKNIIPGKRKPSKVVPGGPFDPNKKKDPKPGGPFKPGSGPRFSKPMKKFNLGGEAQTGLGRATVRKSQNEAQRKRVDDMLKRLYGPKIKPKPKPKKPLKKVLGDKIKPRLKKKPLKKRLKGG